MKQSNFCFEIFRNQELSLKLENNIRFCMVERCLLPFLEGSDHLFLAEFFIAKYEILLKYLNSTLEGTITAHEKILHIMEKSVVFKIFEVLFRKIPSEVLKKQIHERIIGPDTQGNEITKKIVLICHNYKKCQHPYH